VGASAWLYVEPHRGDVEASFNALRERVFNSDDYYWIDNGYLGPRRATLVELDQLKGHGRFWDVGTHSIIDMDRVVRARSDQEGAVRELPRRAAKRLFGTRKPTRADFDAHEKDLPYLRRWSGLYQLLYTEDVPTHIAIWGFSGD
jgi:hypothetical protein